MYGECPSNNLVKAGYIKLIDSQNYQFLIEIPKFNVPTR